MSRVMIQPAGKAPDGGLSNPSLSPSPSESQSAGPLHRPSPSGSSPCPVWSPKSKAGPVASDWSGSPSISESIKSTELPKFDSPRNSHGSNAPSPSSSCQPSQRPSSSESSSQALMSVSVSVGRSRSAHQFTSVKSPIPSPSVSGSSGSRQSYAGRSSR